MPDSLDSVVWSRRGENMVAACLPGSVFFMPTCSAWLWFALWNPNWKWPHASSIPCHVVLVPDSHNNHQDPLEFWCPGWLSCSSSVSKTPLEPTISSLPETRISLPLPHFSCFRPSLFSLVLFLHSSCPGNQLSNYQKVACRFVVLDWVISTDCFLWDSAKEQTCKDLPRRH